MKVLSNLLVCLSLSMLALPAQAQVVEKPNVSVAIGTWVLQYLPLPVAEAKGFFAAEGLQPKVINFDAGGSRALQALLGGSTDTVVGFYDHTLRMQAAGKHIRCVTLIAQMSGLVLAVRSDLADRIKDVAQLAGRRIGVTALGSSTDFMGQYLTRKAGIAPGSVTVVAVGSGPTAVAAVERRAVEAIVTQDPAATLLLNRKLIVPLVDLRTMEGNQAAFGGLDPTACLYTTEEFIQKNPVTVQRLVNAFARSLAWIQASTPAEITAAMPKEYTLNDPATFTAIVEQSKQEFPATGRMNPDDLKRALDVVTGTDEKVRNFHIDMDATYTNRFVDAVPAPAAGK